MSQLRCISGPKKGSWNANAAVCNQIIGGKHISCRSQWPCGLRCGSAAARLLGLWVRIPPGAWLSVSCECCVLSDRGLCDGGPSSRGVLPSVVCLKCDSEASKWGGLGPQGAVEPLKKNILVKLRNSSNHEWRGNIWKTNCRRWNRIVSKNV
jgi:hypothetical protein